MGYYNISICYDKYLRRPKRTSVKLELAKTLTPFQLAVIELLEKIHEDIRGLEADEEIK